MYTLLSGLYKHLVQKDDYFLLILGLDNAGKSVRAATTVKQAFHYLVIPLFCLFYHASETMLFIFLVFI